MNKQVLTPENSAGWAKLVAEIVAPKGDKQARLEYEEKFLDQADRWFANHE